MNSKQLRVVSIYTQTVTACAVTLLICATQPALAQSDELLGFADMPAENQGQTIPDQRSHYPDQFNAAEQALSKGLGQKPSKPAQLSFPSPEDIKHEIAVKPSASGPVVHRVKSPADSIDDNLLADLEPLPAVSDELAAPQNSQVARNASFSQPAKSRSSSATESVKKTVAPSGREALLQKRLVASEARVHELERQLSESRGQLAAAELEVTRLSSVVENSSRARLNLPQLPSAKSKQITASDPITTSTATTIAPVRVAPDAPADMQVAIISLDKADLRLGPGKNHSPLMSLRKGSRLAIEARQGEWYRVFAPNGQRAWIHASAVRFGEGAASLNDGSSVRMKGFDATIN